MATPTVWGGGLTPPAGFVLRIGPNGENPELFCGGLRNVYAIAFNADGELFGFDNDPNNGGSVCRGIGPMRSITWFPARTTVIGRAPASGSA